MLFPGWKLGEKAGGCVGKVVYGEGGGGSRMSRVLVEAEIRDSRL